MPVAAINHRAISATQKGQHIKLDLYVYPYGEVKVRAGGKTAGYGSVAEAVLAVHLLLQDMLRTARTGRVEG